MHKQRLLAACFALLGMSATVGLWLFGPPLGLRVGVHSDLWITLGLFGSALLLTLGGRASQPITRLQRWFIEVPAGLTVVAAVLNVFGLASAVWVSCYTLVLIAGVGMLIVLWFPWNSEPSARDLVPARTLILGGASLLVLAGLWLLMGMLMYVPADEATHARIHIGMTEAEVRSIFGRPPFLDSEKLPALLRPADDTREFGWDGPEGMILVNFDREGHVVRSHFSRRDEGVSALDWLRSRLGLWPQ